MLRNVVVMMLMMMFGSMVNAEEKLGVPVYPGAKSEPAMSKLLTSIGPGKSFCYQTADGLDRVVAYYKKLGLSMVRGDKESAKFTNGKADVLVNNPWMDAKTNRENRTTLISISESGS